MDSDGASEALWHYTDGEAEITEAGRIPGGLALAWELARSVVSSSYRGDLVARWLLQYSRTRATEPRLWVHPRRWASVLAHGLAIERFRARNGRLPATLTEVSQSVTGEVQAILDPGAVRYELRRNDYTLEPTFGERP